MEWMNDNLVIGWISEASAGRRVNTHQIVIFNHKAISTTAPHSLDY